MDFARVAGGNQRFDTGDAGTGCPNAVDTGGPETGCPLVHAAALPVKP